MNYIICSVILIYLCLGNVACIVRGLQHNSAHHSKENIIFNGSLQQHQKFKCVSEEQRDHQLSHVYSSGYLQHPIYIGDIPKQKDVKITEFMITLETFDNNTEIHCDKWDNESHNFLQKALKVVTYITEKISSQFGSKTSDTPDSRFKTQKGSSETVKDSEGLAVIKYNETQQVSFTCQGFNRKNLCIGIINMTSNIIETHKNTFLDRMFTKSQNGTVLCCIYYDESREGYSSWITRRVVNKTLLVYDETGSVTDRKNSSEDEVFDSSKKSGDDASDDSSGQDAGLDKQGVVTGKPDADSGNQASGPSNQVPDLCNQASGPSNQVPDPSNRASGPSNQVPDPSNQASDPSNHTTIIYIVSAVAVIFILLVVSVIYLKRFRKKPEVEVDTKVLYSDLEFLRRNESKSLPRTEPVEESPYALIIGEIRP